MKIAGFPKAKYDECLSSWVWRCSQSRYPTGMDFQSFLREVDDPDFSFSELQAGLDRLGISQGEAQCFFDARSPWVFPWEQRSVFCPQCLGDDIAAGGLPYWRKSWSYLHCPICIEHNRLLVLFERYYPYFDKAWIAFSDDCIAPLNSSTRCRVPWKQPPSSLGVISLALKIQKLLTTAHHKATIYFSACGTMCSSSEILRVSRFLFEYFLFPRLRVPTGDGVARGMQYGVARVDERMTREQAKLYGCNDCDVFSRVTALILIGCVLRLVPVELFKRVRRSLRLFIHLESGAAYDIGRCGLTFLTRNEHRAAVDFFESLSDSMRGLLSDFLNGLKEYRF